MTLPNNNSQRSYLFSQRINGPKGHFASSQHQRQKARFLILDSRCEQERYFHPFFSCSLLKTWLLSKAKNSYTLSNRLGWTYKHIKTSMSAGDSVTYALVRQVPGNIIVLKGIIIARRLGDEAELLFVFVRNASRRSGLGSYILTNSLEHLEKTGAANVFLEVAKSNRAAIVLYKKSSFELAGTRKNYYRRARKRPEDAFIYKRRFFTRPVIK